MNFDPSSEHQFLSERYLGLCHRTQFLSGFLRWHFAQKSQNLSEQTWGIWRKNLKIYPNMSWGILVYFPGSSSFLLWWLIIIVCLLCKHQRTRADCEKTMGGLWKLRSPQKDWAERSRFCRGPFGVTRDLVEFCILGENIETGWPHFKKKILRHLFSNEYTWKIELNSIDFQKYEIY
jgi:hypothetical protein